jgi:hypothetical protein
MACLSLQRWVFVAVLSKITTPPPLPSAHPAFLSSGPSGRRMLADDEAGAVRAVARSLKNRRRAALASGPSEAAKLWQRIEGLMNIFCEGDMGAAVVTGASRAVAGRACGVHASA